MPKSQPLSEAAGNDNCDAKTLGSWTGDSWRLAPYQYAVKNVLVGQHGQRGLTSGEQLLMLGYNSDHLDLKQKVTEDQRQQFIGNTRPVIVVACLLLKLVMTEEQAGTRDVTTKRQAWKALENRARQVKQGLLE